MGTVGAKRGGKPSETLGVEPFVLPAILSLDALDTVRDALVERLDQGALEVRADAVERVSANGLFLLLSAAETAQRSGTDFAITAASPVFAAAIGKLGLKAAFASVLKA